MSIFSSQIRHSTEQMGIQNQRDILHNRFIYENNGKNLHTYSTLFREHA